MSSFTDGKAFEIVITLEIDHEQRNIIGVSAMLHDFLKIDKRVSNIKWYEQNKPNDLGTTNLHKYKKRQDENKHHKAIEKNCQ